MYPIPLTNDRSVYQQQQQQQQQQQLIPLFKRMAVPDVLVDRPAFHADCPPEMAFHFAFVSEKSFCVMCVSCMKIVSKFLACISLKK